MKPYGPREIKEKTRLTCEGCPACKLEPWEEFLENDERDSGTSATCTETGQNITCYWNTHTPPPGWCPGDIHFMQNENAKDARIKVLEEALRGLNLECDDCNCHGTYRCARCKALEALGGR